MTVVDDDTEQILHRVVRTAFNDRTVINLSVNCHQYSIKQSVSRK